MTAIDATDSTDTIETTHRAAGESRAGESRAGESPETGYRTYEIYQRQRVGESTALVKPRQLYAPGFLADPYPTLAALREHYPCYRDWAGNAFWITRYDDVTSVFVDDPNYETRPKRWFYDRLDLGRDLRDHLDVLRCVERRTDEAAERLARDTVGAFAASGVTDLATEFAARFALDVLCHVVGVPADEQAWFVARYLRMQRGSGWEPNARAQGLTAIDELAARADRWLAARRSRPADDLLGVLAGLELDRPVNGGDVVATLLEGDHETLHGALANLWFLLLTHPDQLALVEHERRLVKFAYLETLRHSAPVLAARRFARHEVERFGRLLPDGALVVCSAAAANRDPRVFHDPDRFDVLRRDLCQREPRGHYRADGLASGVAFGLGTPSKYPAVPEDRPRSRYAITRDAVVTASHVLLDTVADLRVADGATPALRSLRLGEMHTCWELPVSFTGR
jgi:pulcherriminic acid synthase